MIRTMKAWDFDLALFLILLVYAIYVRSVTECYTWCADAPPPLIYLGYISTQATARSKSVLFRHMARCCWLLYFFQGR